MATTVKDMLAAAQAVVPRTENVIIHPDGLAAANEWHQVLQPTEAMATFADWLDTENPRLSWEVALGRARAMFIDPTRIPPAQAFRAAFRAQVRALLSDDSVLAIPTTPFPAPAQGQRRKQRRPLSRQRFDLLQHRCHRLFDSNHGSIITRTGGTINALRAVQKFKVQRSTLKNRSFKYSESRNLEL
jgi:Asp-tRNA(Asn)/Glu-tRNA(Gln) amidotransferase A subunit family amidase